MMGLLYLDHFGSLFIYTESGTFLLACINILFSLKISPGLSDLLIALYQFTALFFSNQLTSI